MSIINQAIVFTAAQAREYPEDKSIAAAVKRAKQAKRLGDTPEGRSQARIAISWAHPSKVGK